METIAPATGSTPASFPLDSVIATSVLEQRPNRQSNRDAETDAELELTRELAKSPLQFFQKLVDTVLKLSVAESAGISLLDEKNGRFVWPAVAGGLVPYVGGGTPRNFGPCGTVLDQDKPILFQHPERHFGYLEPIAPSLEEVLLIPFHVDGKPVGTVWAVIHSRDRQFQLEDKRLLQNLSAFASTAFRVLAGVGALEPMLLGNAKV